MRVNRKPKLRTNEQFYQGAVKADQAESYVSLHLSCYLQIASLTQESLASDDGSLVRSPDRTAPNEEPLHESPGLNIRQVNRELYRNAIKSITDMLTFAKLIDDGALLTTIFINQAFSPCRVSVYPRYAPRSEKGQYHIVGGSSAICLPYT